MRVTCVFNITALHMRATCECVPAASTTHTCGCYDDGDETEPNMSLATLQTALNYGKLRLKREQLKEAKEQEQQRLQEELAAKERGALNVLGSAMFSRAIVKLLNRDPLQVTLSVGLTVSWSVRFSFF